MRLFRRSPFSRLFSVHAEAMIVICVLLLWQAARVPLEGSSSESVAHAHSWLALQHRLHIDSLENAVVRLVHDPVLLDLAHFFYANVHLFAIVAFMVAARLTAPLRYPALRTAFVLLHVPALIAIALFPLAPPTWIAHHPFWSGAHLSDAQLTGSLAESLRNSTAAVASEHFGYPVFIAAGALLLAPRSPFAWLTLLHPPIIFLVIVGTGHHYVLDAVVGALSVAFGLQAAHYLHRTRPALGEVVRTPARRVIGYAAAYALLVDWADGLSSRRVPLEHPSLLTFLAPLLALLAFALTRAPSRSSAPPTLSYAGASAPATFTSHT